MGQDSTLAIVTWGLGCLAQTSFRTLFAQFADELSTDRPSNGQEVAQRWCDFFWTRYSAEMKPVIEKCRQLASKPAFVPGSGLPVRGARTEREERQFEELNLGLVVGFCIGGYLATSERVPFAFQTIFEPLATAPPQAVAVTGPRFWGAPNMVDRLIVGCDGNFRETILASGKWVGTESDLDQLIGRQELVHGILPIRDAVDFVHTCIFSTIKALKFSNFSQICGGPIELAVITTDRKFRWIRHKTWDTAVTEGVPL